MLKTVFAVGVIAQTSLRGEVSTEEHSAIFGLALYASRVVCAVVGAHHKGFAQIVFCACKDVEVVFIGVGVGKHVGNRAFFGLGVACSHIVKLVPIAEETVVIEVGGYLPLVGFLNYVGANPLCMARGKLVALCASIAKVRP